MSTGSGGGQPTENTVVVTCMDARIDPLAVLGLPIGGAQVIRNAGGRVSDDVLRSLILSTTAFRIQSVVVMHHTLCAAAAVSNDQMAERLAGSQGEAASIDFLPIGDPQESLWDDVARVRDCPHLPEEIKVRGVFLDLDSGGLTEVVGASQR